ncbi:winged helix-turn-helix transcriptional regulator [Streptomyces phyllanthi]|nr:helix-turn-helix domain-containing protein [Streptomyces phyllanthi]
MAVAASVPASEATEIGHVHEAVGVLAPRWSVWVLQTLQHHGTPMRFAEIQQKLPIVYPTSLTQRLQRLTDDGLLTLEPQEAGRTVYALTEQSSQLTPVYAALADWARVNLEDVGPTAHAQQAEDALTLLSGKYTTDVLWALRKHGELRSGELWRLICPEVSQMNISHRLRQLREDGLVARTGEGTRSPYHLTPAAAGLGSVYEAISAWSTGRAIATGSTRAVWGSPTTNHQATGSVAAAAIAASPRVSASVTVARVEPTWRRADLFSHAAPIQPRSADTLAGPHHSGRTR